MALSMNGVNFTGRTSAGQAYSAPTFRYFRLYVTGITGSVVRVAAFNLRVAGVLHPASPMTATSSPSPLVASESSYFAVNYTGWRAFGNPLGNSDSYRWISNGYTPQWVGIDFGVGNEFAPDQVQIAPDSQGATEYITNFQVQGSNTGVWGGEQTVIYTSATLSSGDWSPLTLTSFAI
jgi:hypothetical protein